MEKDTRLLNIYLRIHNKRPITLDDLRYLAEFSPECFEKTCQNVIYNKPETKPIMEPATTASETTALVPVNQKASHYASNSQPVQPTIDQILDNFKLLEVDEFPIGNIDTDEVKHLLGNLYMELLFPHNDQDTFMDMMEGEYKSIFDRKV